MKKAFTLIELLIVIGILSGLVVTILITLNPAQTNKKNGDLARIVTLNKVRAALEAYSSEKGTYPGQFETYYWISDNNYPGIGGTWPPCESTTGGLKLYLSNVCGLKDPQGNKYAYALQSEGGDYKLGAKFELPENRGAPFTYGSSNTAVQGWYELKNAQ